MRTTLGWRPRPHASWLWGAPVTMLALWAATATLTTLAWAETPAVERHRPAGHLEVEAWAAGTFSPSLGGDVAGACAHPCVSTLAGGEAVAATLGWQTASGFGVAMTAGTLRLVQETTTRAGELVPIGKPPNAGKIDDRLVLRGVTLGLAGSYRFGRPRFPVTARLGTGVLLGELVDTRSGTFQSSEGTSYDSGVLSDSPAARYVYVTPEVRGGVYLTDHLSIDVGVQAILLFAVTQPRWTNDRALLAAEDGPTSYPSEVLTAKWMLVLSPGADVRYDF